MFSKKIALVSSIILAGLALFGTGCASIVHGGGRSVSINSQPAGAKVVITKTNTGAAVHTAITPTTVVLPPRGGYFRGQPYTVTITMDGYAPATVQLRPTISGWYLGNVIFGGLIGLIVVDPLTGSMWNLSPDKIEQTLTQQQAKLLKEKDGFLVVLHSQLTDTEKQNLVRIN